MINTILAYPICENNRDKIDKEVGHNVIVKFKQPIVDDSIDYKDENNNRIGYSLVNSKTELDVGSL